MKRLNTILLFTLLPFLMMGQVKFNSPYSSLGFGNQVVSNNNAIIGMGGISAAYNDNWHNNLDNPASLGYLTMTNYNVGFYGGITNLKSGDISTSTKDGNLSHMSLSFPLTNPISRVLERKGNINSWGMNVAILPLYKVGYDIQSTVESQEIGLQTNSFQGYGGVNKFQLSNGYRHNDMSFGLDLGYIFGNTTRIRSVNFNDIDSGYNNNYQDFYRTKGFYWNLGAQYVYRFKKTNEKGELENTGEKFSFGIHGSNNSTLSLEGETTNMKINKNLIGVTDTVFTSENLDKKAVLPGTVGVGVMYTAAKNYSVGVDFKYKMGSSYKHDILGDELKNGYRFAVGGSYVKDPNSYKNYFSRIEIRTGLFYEKDPRHINNEQLTNKGFSVGFGLPLVLQRRQKSFVDVAFEVSSLGLKDEISETYYNIRLGFTLNDNSWFYKQKFK